MCRSYCGNIICEGCSYRTADQMAELADEYPHLSCRKPTARTCKEEIKIKKKREACGTEQP